MATSSYPPKPPRDVHRTLTDIARYLVLVEEEDPEDVAETFERHAQEVRDIGHRWSLPNEHEQ